jgi:hypothetical protein
MTPPLTTREPIFAALFTLGQTVVWTDPGSGATIRFGYGARRIQTSDQIPAETMPALLQGVGPEEFTAKFGAPPKRILTANWLIYYKPYTAPQSSDPLTNAVMDGIEAVFVPDSPTGNVTLGGLVTHAWIEGDVFKAAGDLNDQAMIVVPIKMLIP